MPECLKLFFKKFFRTYTLKDSVADIQAASSLKEWGEKYGLIIDANAKIEEALILGKTFVPELPLCHRTYFIRLESSNDVFSHSS